MYNYFYCDCFGETTNSPILYLLDGYFNVDMMYYDHQTNVSSQSFNIVTMLFSSDLELKQSFSWVVKGWTRQRLAAS